MKNNFNILPLLGIALVIVSMGVLLDAVFHLTKAVSFFSGHSVWQITTIIINSIAILLIPVVVTLWIVQLLFFLLRHNAKACRYIRYASLFILSGAFLTIPFIHLDTFIYTSFRFNVADLPAIAIFFLEAGIVVAAFILTIKKGDALWLTFESKARLIKYSLIVLFIFFGISTVHRSLSLKANNDTSPIIKSSLERLPNIILFSSDGLDPANMSVYGYTRETTPNLNRFAKESTLFKMAFTNSGTTMGSVVSTLNGKSPFTTKVIYTPNILLGRDSFENLPSILAANGYYCIDYGPPLHSSPNLTNMWGFHNVNGRATRLGLGERMDRLKRLYNMELYFIGIVIERIWERIGFITKFSKKMYHKKEMVKGYEMTIEVDSERTEALVRKIEEIDGPFFIHIHLMKTHGPEFHGITSRFSAGKTQKGNWETDFYDDAILTMDERFGEVLSALKKTGKFDNTLIAFFTDHGKKWGYDHPIPLIVHMPGQKKPSVVDTPVQLMDIAPSLLSYLKIKKPAWMEGAPVFEPLDRERLGERTIYTLMPETIFKNGRSVGPPFYGIQTAAIIKQGVFYNILLKTGQETMHILDPKRLNPSGKERERLKLEYRKELLSFLRSKEIDTRSLSEKE